MGGILFVVPVLLITGTLNIINLLGMDAIGQSTLFLFFCLGSHAILGAVDDLQGISGIGLYMFGLGLSALLFKVYFGTVKTIVGFQPIPIPGLSKIPVIGKDLGTALGGVLGSHIDLSDDELGNLAEAIGDARHRQAAELHAAGEKAFGHIPRLLRGPIRKVMGA